MIILCPLSLCDIGLAIRLSGFKFITNKTACVIHIVVQSLSRVWLSVTPRTVAYRAPLSTYCKINAKISYKKKVKILPKLQRDSQT